MELKKFFKKSRKFYLLVLLLLIFTVPVALSGCGGGGSGSGGGSTPSISGGGGGNSSAQSYVIPQVYGGVNPLSNYTVTLYEVNPNGTVSSIGQCTTNSYGSCGTFGITFTWDGNSQDTFYATASNSSGSVILLGFIGGISSSSYNVGNMSYFPLTNNMISGSVVIDENTTIAAIQSVIMSGALVSISGNTIDLSYANSAQAFTNYDDAFANYTGGSSNPTMSGVNGTLATNVQYTTEILSNAVALCVQNNSNCSTIFSDTAAASAYYPSPSNTLESAINMVEAVDLISGADPSLHINSSDADTIGNSIFNFVITNQSFIPYTLPTLQAGTYSPSFLTTGTGNSLM
jgi:hypothetical protein